ncbi:MAG TPA: transglycosylase SLT domain-containing protein [Dissulfurispiraceae bacterium]|nr:transglycosylase SLT domain-containing protein [Dissulfurispiraceae bacterium]
MKSENVRRVFSKSFINAPAVCALAVLLLFLTAVPGRAADLALIDAYQKQDFRALVRYAAAHKNTPLEPYFIARMVNVREASFGPLSPSLARDLERFEGVPPIEKLRAALLKEWARQGNWKQVASHAHSLPEWAGEKDMELRCVLLEFSQMQHKPAADTRRSLFSLLQDFPALCSGAFAGAVASGELAPETALLKVMQLAAFKKNGAAARLAQLLDAELNDQSALRGKSAKAIEVLTAARENIDGGLQLLESQKTALAPETVRALTVHIGALAARRQDPRAHRIISAVNGYLIPLDGPAAEWRTRAAIAASSWPDILVSVEHMNPALRNEQEWQFWLARALQQLGRRQEAGPLFSKLAAQPGGYYGILAAEQIGVLPSFAIPHYSIDQSFVQQLAEHSAVKRALALHKVGLWGEAAQEWRILMRGSASTHYYAAAHFAKEHGLIDRQIYLAGKAVEHVNLRLKYPLEHKREVVASSDDAGIAPEWAWAVIRQESRFVSHAVSSAGAVGLMQLMPATAKNLASRVRLGVAPTRQVLMTPTQNIVLGTAFLGSLLRKYDGNYAFASAAYNAGPGRVDQWRGKLHGIDGFAFVELIPFEETRDYTKKVLANSVMYALVTGQEPIRLTKVLNRKVR